MRDSDGPHQIREHWEVDTLQIYRAAARDATVPDGGPDFRQSRDAQEALGRIRQLPEVRKAMAELHLTAGVKVFSTLVSPHPQC